MFIIFSVQIFDRMCLQMIKYYQHDKKVYFRARTQLLKYIESIEDCHKSLTWCMHASYNWLCISCIEIFFIGSDI